MDVARGMKIVVMGVAHRGTPVRGFCRLNQGLAIADSPLAPAVIQVLEAAANSTNPEIPERLAHGSPPNSGIFDF
jgi:hypothetical protein